MAFVAKHPLEGGELCRGPVIQGPLEFRCAAAHRLQGVQTAIRVDRIPGPVGDCHERGADREPQDAVPPRGMDPVARKAHHLVA